MLVERNGYKERVTVGMWIKMIEGGGLTESGHGWAENCIGMPLKKYGKGTLSIA